MPVRREAEPIRDAYRERDTYRDPVREREPARSSDFLRGYSRDARNTDDRREPRPARDAVQVPDDVDPNDVPAFLRRPG